MSANVYSRIIDNLEAKDMELVLRDSIPHNEIINFARKVGLTYNGRRIKSMPIDTLITDLAEDFFTEGKGAESIIRSLDRHNINFINKIKFLNTIFKHSTKLYCV